MDHVFLIIEIVLSIQRFVMLFYFFNNLQNAHNKRWREGGIFMVKERINTIKQVLYGKQNITSLSK